MFAGTRNNRNLLLFLIALFCGSVNFLSLSAAADRIRVAKGGYSPSTPPYFTYAAPFLLKQDIIVEDILMSSGSLAGQALSSGTSNCS